MSQIVRPTAYSPITTAKETTKQSLPRPSLKDLPKFTNVAVTDNKIQFDLSDGRTVFVPLHWSQRLSTATPEQRQRATVSSYNIFWDDIDEIIGVENVLYGNKLYL